MEATIQDTNLGQIAMMALKGWWFILLSCVAAASFVYFFAPQEPVSFVSRAIVSGSGSDLALLPSSVVIDPVVSSLGLAATADAKPQARQEVAAAISYRSLAEGLFEVNFQWYNAEQSETILAALIRELSAQLAPRGGARTDIELEKEELEVSVDALEQFRSNMVSGSPDALGGDLAERAIAIAMISKEINASQRSILALSRELQGRGVDWVQQPATLWLEVQPSSRRNKAVMAAIGAGIISAILVILAHAVMGRRPARNLPS